MARIAGVTPEQTRGRLIDAAARTFERRGYEGATVAEIAREAGVTTGAIYAHWPTKAELLVDALRAHGERATAALFPPGTHEDAAGVLVALGTHLPDRDRHAGALLLEALLAARRDPELAGVLAASLGDRERLLAALLLEGQVQGTLTDDVPAAAAARFALMVGLGSLLVRALELPPTDRDDWTAFIRRVVGAFAVPDPT